MPWMRSRDVAGLRAELAEARREQAGFRKDLNLLVAVVRAELGVRLDDVGPVPVELVTAIESGTRPGGQPVKLHVAGREWTAIIDSEAVDPAEVWQGIVTATKAAS